jgi:hypothetical protein
MSDRPLADVRVLAIEQMQALPYATQMLARLGATVVKVEPPGRGESGRQALPAIEDPDGRLMGATFLRNNFNKRSIAVDLKNPDGRALVLQLAPRFDIVAQNFKAGTIDRLGLGYDDIAKVHPAVVYLSVSGFGTTNPTRYNTWPAYAPVAEAMLARPNDPGLSLLLGLEAVRRYPHPITFSALYDAAADLRERRLVCGVLVGVHDLLGRAGRASRRPKEKPAGRGWLSPRVLLSEFAWPNLRV